ncbi:hypothetical protein C7S15_7566 [Burkholderia cepacia]|nr:hypothetical protein [Burkholderia cepacia]
MSPESIAGMMCGEVRALLPPLRHPPESSMRQMKCISEDRTSYRNS